METRPLGNSGIEVPLICLGTMTWGEQNSRSEAFLQMDYALDHGVNFWDAAEMYPVPVKAETAGETERIIGQWFEQNGRRSEVILASKVTGRSDRTWVRSGDVAETRINPQQITEAIEGSLRRMKTDYIDLYQVHWPDRRMGLWGEGGGSYVHKDNQDETPIAEAMEALARLVTSGKVRCLGVSNETPWGVSQYLHCSEEAGMPRIVSIQNSYSLLNRIFEGGLSEFSYREDIGLLAYTPLAMGVLSGKYLGGRLPRGSRLELFPDFMTRYQKPGVEDIVRQYAELAQEFGLSPTAMALGFVNTRPFVTSNIIGATTIEQLRENIASASVRIPEELENRIDQIHLAAKNPAAA